LTELIHTLQAASDVPDSSDSEQPRPGTDLDPRLRFLNHETSEILGTYHLGEGQMCCQLRRASGPAQRPMQEETIMPDKRGRQPGQKIMVLPAI
jgi:hypothetical protein